MRRAFYEHLEAPAGCSWRCQRGTGRFVFAWHMHPEYELTLITKGTGMRYIGHDVVGYHAGDLVLIGPNVPHTWVSSGDDNEAYVCQFPADLLGVGWLELSEFRVLRELFVTEARAAVFDATPVERRIAELVGLAPLPRTLGLVAVLESLATQRQPQILNASAVNLHPDATRLQQLLDFMGAHLIDGWSLAELSRIAHLSPSATSRYFHRMMGMTITQWRSRARIAMACRELVDTEESIANISRATGYQNLSHFNREFRRLQECTPAQFRAASR